MNVPKIRKRINQSTFINGITEKEAKQRIKKYGHNVITDRKKISVSKILANQFKDFMTLILLASTLVSVFMGQTTEAVTIIVIVILNAVLGFIQEYRTEKTMEALKKLASPSANVIRDGSPVTIPAEQIVPGDLIILESGDRVPADAILIEANNMKTDESLLTGESLPVEKKATNNKLYNKKKVLAGDEYIYMGTVILSGRGRAIVDRTAMDTEMGQIAGMIQDIDSEETPLQKRLAQLGKYIVYGCIIVCAVVSITGILRGESLYTMLLAGISLAVAAVPEGLPATVTIALAIGVQKMIKRKALIRKLPAVETLGCATVICSDKTGTLTENKMTVTRVFSGGNMYKVTGSGIAAEGEFIHNGKKVNPLTSDSLRIALEIAAVCNNAEIRKIEDDKKNGTFHKIKSIFKSKARWVIGGDPTEASLLAAALKSGLNRQILKHKYHRFDEIPFDSDRKCMSVMCYKNKNEPYVFTKGAPDEIVKRCNRIYTSKGVTALTFQKKRKLIRINDKMACNALRNIAVAYRRIDSHNANVNNIENNLVFAGLIGMIDPPRKEVLDSVIRCKTAGIRPVMVTGDHKNTAEAIAKELCIYNSKNDEILTGSELDRIKDRELIEKIERVKVYARVSPRHKLRIVRLLKKTGHVVAMTGDGVNDAPAVKEADIGVSMGIMGTDVTKEASSMILLNDNFTTIVAAVEEGRTIYNNIRKFIRYLLACNIGEVLTMFIGMLTGLPIPLLPIQILWVNLVTDGLPAVALGLEPSERDIMLQSPRNTSESIFSQGLTGLIIFRGIFLGLSTLAVFISILHFTGNVVRARTAAFATLVLTQLIHVFECKSEKKSIFEIPLFNNMALILAVLCSTVMIISVIYIPSFQVVFKTIKLLPNDWMTILGFSFLGPVLASMFISKRKMT